MTEDMGCFGVEGYPVFHAGEMIELQLVSSSKGNQRKWYDKEKGIYVKEQFFYQGRYWKDYLVEVVASEIGQQLPQRCAQVLRQSVCKITDTNRMMYGVCSKDFASNVSYVSFKRILDAAGLYYDAKASIDEKWCFVLETIRNKCNLDYTDFLITMTLIDYLVGNEDRHINNFGVLQGSMGFAVPPLFDFGLGLFEHDLKYEDVPFRECLSLMNAKPFDVNNQNVIDYVKKRYDLVQYLPKKLNLSAVRIPSAKAGSYLRNRCMKLGIALEGVD